MRWMLIGWIFLVGMLLPVQAGVNAELRRHAAHPLQAAGVNMLLGAVVILLIMIFLRVPIPGRAVFVSAPWWAFVGGLIGATMVFSSLFAAPRLGAAVLIAVLVCGQLISSVIIDHTGFVGYPERAVSIPRLAGVFFLISGVLLIERSA